MLLHLVSDCFVTMVTFCLHLYILSLLYRLLHLVLNCFVTMVTLCLHTQSVVYIYQMFITSYGNKHLVSCHDKNV